MKLKALQSRRLLQGLIKQHEIEFSCNISPGQSDIAFCSLNSRKMCGDQLGEFVCGHSWGLTSNLSFSLWNFFQSVT